MSDLVKIPEDKLSLTDDERDEIYAAGVSISFMQHFVRNFLAQRIAQQDAALKEMTRQRDILLNTDRHKYVETLKGLLRESGRYVNGKSATSQELRQKIRAATDQQLQPKGGQG